MSREAVSVKVDVLRQPRELVRKNYLGTIITLEKEGVGGYDTSFYLGKTRAKFFLPYKNPPSLVWSFSRGWC